MEKSVNERLLARVEELVDIARECKGYCLRATPPAPTPESDPPAHADGKWVMRYLGIGRTTFDTKVKGRLLKPIGRIGSRDYYDRQEVFDLLRRVKESHRSIGYIANKVGAEAPIFLGSIGFTQCIE